MNGSEEWKQHKLTNLAGLRACTFTLANYTPPSAEWDHDHCKGCGTTFAVFDAPEIQHSGYFTSVRSRKELATERELIRQARESGRKLLAKPDTKEWVCADCFQEFRKTLSWKLNSGERA